MESYIKQDIYIHSPKIDRVAEKTFPILVLLLLNVPLGLLLRANEQLSTLHGLLTLGLGIYWLVRDEKPYKSILVISYITGAEVLWRATGANLFWEYGKYASVLLMLLVLFKYRRSIRLKSWPMVYFSLLLPSVLILPRFDREWISFNLSGPLTLAVASILFSSLLLNRQQIKGVLAALISPTIALASIAGHAIATAETISFTAASLKQTSAGFGPNQVSSILGLGAVAALFYLLLENRRKFLRWILFLLTLWLLAQTVLTFSRGGFWTAIGAVVVAGLYLLRDRRNRIVLITATLLLFSLGYFVLFPALNRFSGNTLQRRYSDFGLTGRWEIMQADWIAFQQNPLLGVGPGQSKYYHALTFRLSATHSEYTRVLAEHGTFGAAALLLLFWISATRAFKELPPFQKALTASLTVWALLFMFHAAMRLAAPSILFGLASASFDLGNPLGES